jgi:hypothetical protein
MGSSGTQVPSSYLGTVVFDGAGKVTASDITVGQANGLETTSCTGQCGTYFVEANGHGSLHLNFSKYVLSFRIAVAEGGNHVFLILTGHEETFAGLAFTVLESATGEMRRQ